MNTVTENLFIYQIIKCYYFTLLTLHRAVNKLNSKYKEREKEGGVLCVTITVKTSKSLLQDVNLDEGNIILVLEKPTLQPSDPPPPKQILMTLLTLHSSLSILIKTCAVIPRCLPLSSNQMFLVEICKDRTFLYISRSVQVTKPLKCLKQTEPMCCNCAALLPGLTALCAGTCQCHLCWKPQTAFLSGSGGVSWPGF